MRPHFRSIIKFWDELEITIEIIITNKCGIIEIQRQISNIPYFRLWNGPSSLLYGRRGLFHWTVDMRMRNHCAASANKNIIDCCWTTRSHKSFTHQHSFILIHTQTSRRQHVKSEKRENIAEMVINCQFMKVSNPQTSAQTRITPSFVVFAIYNHVQYSIIILYHIYFLYIYMREWGVEWEKGREYVCLWERHHQHQHQQQTISEKKERAYMQKYVKKVMNTE